MSAARADHYGIAERGKLHALAGDHRRAIACYRLAIRATAGDPSLALCARHYADCTLESLERTGALDDAARWCGAALAHYEATPPVQELQMRDRAALLERLGCIELKRGRPDEAREAFEAAESSGTAAPLAAEMLRHLRARLHLRPEYVAAAQERSGQFCVRRGRVDPARACEVPDALLFAALGPEGASPSTA